MLSPCRETSFHWLAYTASLGCFLFLKILASCCSLQVYCGSAEAGRWVHVDVINGLVNK